MLVRRGLKEQVISSHWHPCLADTPLQSGFLLPFAVSVAPARASEEANRWPENPRQHTTSGLECSSGQQRTEGENGRKVRREQRLPEGHAQGETVGNRANTGRTGKKIPTDEGWDLGFWWSRRESNPRPKVFCNQFYVCSDVFDFLVAVTPTHRLNQQPATYSLMSGQVARSDTIR